MKNVKMKEQSHLKILHTLQPDAHNRKQILLREALDWGGAGSSLMCSLMTNLSVMLVFKQKPAVQSGCTSERDGTG